MIIYKTANKISEELLKLSISLNKIIFLWLLLNQATLVKSKALK